MNENIDFTAKFYQMLENSNISDLGTGKNQEVWRRVVPSPKPIGIVEIDIIEACFLSGNIGDFFSLNNFLKKEKNTSKNK